MLIRDIMTKAVRLIGSATTVREAAQVMRQMDVGALLVLEGDAVAGILTDRDIVARSTSSGADPKSQKVTDIMVQEVAHVFEDQDVQEAAWLMEIKRVRRLAVLGDDSQLVGIVTLDDISLRGHERELTGEVIEFLAQRRRSPAAPADWRLGDDPLPPREPGEGWTFSRL